jgi:hypothetical protein
MEDLKMTKIYLAGPMSGIPQFNFPLFYSAAKELRVQGWEVVSPAEMDDAEDSGAALKSLDGNVNDRTIVKKTWGEFLSRDVKLLADGGIEGIIFLPGWDKSKGARLEAYVGLNLNFKFFMFDPDTNAISPFPAYTVFSLIGRALGHISVPV